jgi:hypothetical protein
VFSSDDLNVTVAFLYHLLTAATSCGADWSSGAGGIVCLPWLFHSRLQPTNCQTLASYGMDDVNTKGGFDGTLTGTVALGAAAQCATLCITKTNTNFFGLVNTASSTNTVDCYCGTAISNTQSAFSNCQPCYGPGRPWQCGNAGSELRFMEEHSELGC